MNSKNVVQHAARMSDHADRDNASVDDRVSHALEEYAASLEKGQPVSRESLLEKYAGVAEELAGCLDSLDFIRDIAPQIGEQRPNDDHQKADQRRAVIGDYRIIREIGRGGMGVVYEAEQLSLGRSVALKVLPYAAMMDPKAITRFKNEARAAATLDHPHIVPVFAVGNERGIYYYAMSLIDGLTVGELIGNLRQSITDDEHSNDRLSIDDLLIRSSSASARSASHLEPTIDSGQPTKNAASVSTNRATRPNVEAAISTHRSRFDGRFFQSIARLGSQAADALHHAHQHGIVHRDIKPGNLMIDKGGKLWITDFGLARIESDVGMTVTGDLIGTLRYMAPEQALAKRIVVDHRADIYSLGASLYELSAFRPPFDGRNREDLLKQIAFEEPKPVRHFNRGVPEDLQTIIHKAISKNPDDRYNTAEELAEDLRAFMDDEPIKAKPLSIAQRATRWIAKRKGLVASFAAVLILAVVGLSISNAMIVQQRNVATEAERKERLERLEADRQRQLATLNAQQARETVDTYLTKVSEDKLLNAPAMQPLRKELLQLALDYYERFIQQQPNDPQLQSELASALVRVGDIEREIGSQADALDAYQQAAGIREQLAKSSPGLAAQLELVEAYRVVAQQHSRMKSTEDRDALLQQMIDVLDRCEAEQGVTAELTFARAKTIRMSLGNSPEEALNNAKEALRLIQSLEADQDELDGFERELVSCRRTLSSNYFSIAAFATDELDTENAYRNAIRQSELAQTLLKRFVAESGSLADREELASTDLSLGAARGNLGALLIKSDATRPEGLRLASQSQADEEQAAAIFEELVRENPLVVDYWSPLATLSANLSMSYQALAVETEEPAHFDDAMRFAVRASEITRRVEKEFPGFSLARPHAWHDQRCQSIAYKALRTTWITDDHKRRLAEQAMVPVLQTHPTERTLADRGNLARLALVANELPSLSEDERHAILESAIKPLLDVPKQDRDAMECGFLGQLLYWAGRYDESRKAFDQCVELRGDRGPSSNLGARWFYIAMLDARSGQLDQARNTYQILAAELQLSKRPDPPTMQELRDLLDLEAPKEEPTSSQLLQQLLDANATFWGAFFTLAQRLTEEGEVESAREAFVAAAERMQLLPVEEMSAAKWGFLAQALYESADYSAAEEALNKNFEARNETRPTISFGPRWWYRSLLLARAGEKETARKYYDQLVNELANHAAPNLAYNERFRKELAQLLEITEPPPYSLEGIVANSTSTPRSARSGSAGQIPDPNFNPVVANPEYELGTGPVVLIDEGHGNFHTVDGRYAGFAKLVKRDGFRVDRHVGPFDEESLAGANVIVIANARVTSETSSSAFNDDEIERLVEWVSGGGSLWLIADHAPFGSASIELAKRFGIEMTNSFAVEPGKRPPTIFRRQAGLLSHPITDGRSDNERVDRVATFTGQGFRVPDDAEPLLQFGGQTQVVVMKPGTRNQVISRNDGKGWLQGAVLKVGEGRVAVFGEASMFSAQVTGPDRIPMGMNSPLAPDNPQFLLNVMHWLTETTRQ